MQTIQRYRTATAHLIRFVEISRVPNSTSNFRTSHAEQFVRYLRTVEVASNGHPHTQKRRLLDKGLKYILETCRAMFGFAVKRRHLSPYAENPFTALDLDRIPVETARPILIFDADQERKSFEACDDWQFARFLTLALAGLRPGELTHLLLADDLDLDTGILRVRNKPALGWQVKTRNEREIPLVEPLVNVLRIMLGSRRLGPVFYRRRFSEQPPPLHGLNAAGLEREVIRRAAQNEASRGRPLERKESLAIARGVWRDAGAIKEDRIRTEFMRLTRTIGLAHLTAPKLFRHLFATCLQDGNVDPLIRNELMGHSPGQARAGNGLAMTATYTHTRPETKRKQLVSALHSRAAVIVARLWRNRTQAGAT